MRSLSVERGKEFTGALYSALQQTREATPATTMYSLTARGRKYLVLSSVHDEQRG